MLTLTIGDVRTHTQITIARFENGLWSNNTYATLQQWADNVAARDDGTLPPHGYAGHVTMLTISGRRTVIATETEILYDRTYTDSDGS